MGMLPVDGVDLGGSRGGRGRGGRWEKSGWVRRKEDTLVGLVHKSMGESWVGRAVQLKR